MTRAVTHTNDARAALTKTMDTTRAEDSVRCDSWGVSDPLRLRSRITLLDRAVLSGMFQ